MNISATILVKGAPRHLFDVVQALHPLNEVLLYDNQAENPLLERCEEFPNVRIVKGDFNGFGPTHNRASELAKHDWILSIDSDEVPSEELIQEISTFSLDPDTVYAIPRKNLYNGQWIRGCGWWPDYALRLYNKKQTQFTNVEVHETIKTEGLRIQKLNNPLLHYSYDSVSDFLTKMQSYSDLFAKQWVGKKRSSPCKAALHASFAFFKSYVLKKGFCDGYAGFLISSYNGHTAFYKYMKLYEANLRRKSL